MHILLFLQYVGSTHNYKNSRQARLSIYELGEDIRAGKLPSHFGPLTFVFTGSGNVSQVECYLTYIFYSESQILFTNPFLFVTFNFLYLRHSKVVQKMLWTNLFF